MKEKERTEENAGNITRSHLAQSLYVNIGTVGDAYRFVDAFFDELARHVAENEEVHIQGFGKFRCLQKKERMGRNPRTGAAAPIAPRRVVSFVASGKFKRLMMQDGDEKTA